MSAEMWDKALGIDWNHRANVKYENLTADITDYIMDSSTHGRLRKIGSK